MPTTLGNLFPLIEQIAEENPPALSFLQPQFTDYAAWQKEARAKLMELLRYNPVRPPLAPEIVEVKDCGDYVREKLYFSSSRAARVPAFLLRPKGQSKPAPAIVALHDHGGYYSFGKEKLVEIDNPPAHLTEFKHTYYSGRSYASELARRGYVVIAIDSFYFGERRMDFATTEPVVRESLTRATAGYTDPLNALHEQMGIFSETVARDIFAAGATWLGIMSHDDRAAVDYLVTRTEVDPDRIGSLGLSMGGHRNNYLFATEPRVKAAVTIGWMTNWRDLLPNHVRMHAWAQFVPGLAAFFELSDVVSIGMPGALMIQQCAQDDLFTLPGMQRACERISQAYAKANLSDRFRCKSYDVPHQFNATMQEDAFAWFDRHLRI